MLKNTLAGFVLTVALIGCNDPMMMGDCESNLDCTDGFDCTTDVCGVGGICRNTTVDDVCPAGQVCMLEMGCVAGSGCRDNGDCDDSVACTNDVCAVGGTCMNMPIDSMCMTGEVCDAVQGCVTDTGCETPADCDDSIACTNDVCGADRMCVNTPVNEMCDTTMMEQCVPGVGCQVVMPCMDDTDCQDGDFCNGREICNTEFGCEPPATPRACDDSDDCTIDRCDAAVMGTDGQMGACVFECDPTMPMCGCTPPAPSCAGTFVVTPAITDNCAGGQVNYNISQLTFVNTAVGLFITPQSSHFGDLNDEVDPWCPQFTATATVPGMFPENFTLQGTFTDDDNFSGMFTANYGGVGGLGGCMERSWAVTGARM